MEVNLHDLGLGNDFLVMIHKIEAKKKTDLIKIKKEKLMCQRTPPIKTKDSPQNKINYF